MSVPEGRHGQADAFVGKVQASGSSCKQKDANREMINKTVYHNLQEAGMEQTPGQTQNGGAGVNRGREGPVQAVGRDRWARNKFQPTGGCGRPAGPGPRPLGGVENGLHRTLDVQFREDDCRMRSGHAPAVMAILRRTVLNLLHTIQRKLETDVSTGLLRDRIGHQPWILAAALP